MEAASGYFIGFMRRNGKILNSPPRSMRSHVNHNPTERLNLATPNAICIPMIIHKKGSNFSAKKGQKISASLCRSLHDLLNLAGMLVTHKHLPQGKLLGDFSVGQSFSNLALLELEILRLEDDNHHTALNGITRCRNPYLKSLVVIIQLYQSLETFKFTAERT
jgi:hypothetical protein